MNAVARAVTAQSVSGRVWLYATYRCNLACTYCLTGSSPKSPAQRLSTDEMLRIAREAKALGFTDLGVTGGEPFLLPDIVETLHALSGILPTVVLTNGTLFTRRRLEEMHVLVERDLAVQISLDRPESDANDAMRAEGNFEQVLQSVRSLVELGVHVRIASTVAHLDPDEAQRLTALVRDLGVAPDDHLVRPIVARGRAASESLGVQAPVGDLPAELTITASGAYYSAFGPTVRDGRTDTDMLLTRTTRPLSHAATALLAQQGKNDRGADSRLGIR